MNIFILYSREYAEDFASYIHRFMRNKGHDVYIDVNRITIGGPWASSIEKIFQTFNYYIANIFTRKVKVCIVNNIVTFRPINLLGLNKIVYLNNSTIKMCSEKKKQNIKLGGRM